MTGIRVLMSMNVVLELMIVIKIRLVKILMEDFHVLVMKVTKEVEKPVSILMNVSLIITAKTTLCVRIQMVHSNVIACKDTSKMEKYVMMLMNVHKLIGVIKMDFVSIHQEASNVCV